MTLDTIKTWLLLVGVLVMCAGCAINGNQPGPLTASARPSRIPASAPTLRPAGTVPAGPTLTPKPTPTFPQGGITATPGQTIVIAPNDALVQIQMGDRLVIVPPVIGLTWDVTFNTQVLELGPGMDPTRPLASGLVLIGSGPGATVVRFVTKAARCDPKIQLCPGAPAFQFAVSVRVK